MKKNANPKKGKPSPLKDSGNLRKPSKLQPIRTKAVKKTSNPALFADDDELDGFDEDVLNGFDDYEGDPYDEDEDM